MQIEATTRLDTPDGSARAKMCSVAFLSSGQNLPCPKCMNTGGTMSFYAQNATYSTTADSFIWQIGSVKNYRLTTLNVGDNINEMT